LTKDKLGKHQLEELKRTTCEEALRNLGHETDTEDQVSNFLRCCLRLHNDPNVARRLTHVLATHMGKELTNKTISTPLLERDLCQVSK
jgi:hypothetical protein